MKTIDLANQKLSLDEALNSARGESLLLKCANGEQFVLSKADTIYEKVQALPESAQTAMLRMVESLAENPSAGKAGGLGENFRQLAETWRQETKFFSFMRQRALHPAYQRIIGMGWPAVPLLLQELRRQTDHWLWALHAITGEQPARETDTLQAAALAWLNWGRERGLLPDAERGTHEEFSGTGD